MTTDKLIKLYEERSSKKMSHGQIFDLLRDFVQIISSDMLDDSPTDGFMVMKRGNNIWNYVKMELDKRDFKFMKQDGYSNLINKVHTNNNK